MSNWNAIQYTFKVLCLIAALILVGMWMQRYLLDADISVIETKGYFDTKDDKLPVMTFCFDEGFDEEHFNIFGSNISNSRYKDYLLGDYFDDDVSKVNYTLVSTNISKFILSYEIRLRNGSSIFGQDYPYNDWIRLLPSHSWDSWGQFVKCFGLEIVHKDVMFTRLYLTRDIFPGTIRPQSGGFAVLSHFANQTLASFHTVIRQWTKRDNISNYWMAFALKGMTAIVNRYKPHQDNCVENWKEYDYVMMRKHLKKAGCKTPFQLTKDTWPICKNKSKMKEAVYSFSQEADSLRPCREIDSLDIELGQSEADTFNMERYLKFPREYWNNWFGLTIRILNNRFKLIVQKKEVDFQTLVGYVGGYIGIFIGFALVQIPEILLDTFLFVKKMYQRTKGRSAERIISDGAFHD